MVVSGAKSLKRVKKRVTADHHDFFTFPSPSLAASESFSIGPFRSNIRSFLTKYALLPPPSALFPHLLTWQILFRVGEITEGSESGPAVVCLDVVEEDVARSRSVYCDQCRVFGWSGNPVCGKRYHFIIKANGGSIGGYHKPCMCCGDSLHLSESKCKSCNHVTTSDDVEEWVYHQLENTSHLLHGVVHANGYGHLLRVNGREGGSRFLSGCHIMDFWDRLCKTLGVRKVSVMDVSKKYGLEYRLLHAIMKRHPWYGEWGYNFGSGSYCLTKEAHKSAVDNLSNLPLSIFLSHEQKPHSRVQDMILYYQSLSEHELVNMRDLFCFLMGLMHSARKNASKSDDVTCKKRRFDASGLSSSWGKSDIERVEEAMLRVLRAVSGSNWVSRRALRGAVCKVASPELLDYCLAELGGKVVYGGTVNSRRNPETGVDEFRIDATSFDGFMANSNSSGSKCPSEENLLQCLRYLYESLLHPRMMLNYVEEDTKTLAMSSAQKLLDCKQLIKDYCTEMLPVSDLYKIRISCQVELVDQSEDSAARTPPEIIVLPTNATVSDLKIEAANVFQDVYLMFRRFQVDELLGYRGVDDSTQVKHLLKPNEVVCIRGRCSGKNGVSKFRMERGLERWTVECSCGAKDDDGERMMACDTCGVWRHTRCSGIPDIAPVPARFVCQRCQNCDSKPISGGHLKDETVTSVSTPRSSFFGNGVPVLSDR
ncbi:PHD finger protein At1g33420-like [Vicia villosa]|uniref:PHD finger protein At1g33420-like n=1 Tax=Vicia villosa TaxID=3911 RepID=UPI00273C9759|nr:PHD finger protein At1g33420-like [Vicia villosa]